MATTFHPEQEKRLRSVLVPEWEERIFTLLRRRVPIDIDYRSLESAGARHAEALATLSARGGETVLGAIHDAIRRICTANPTQAAHDLLAATLTRIRISHSQDWLDVGVQMLREDDGGPIDDRARVPKAHLVLVGSLDRGPRGTPREPSIRGAVVDWFGGLLGERDYESEIRSDIRPAWEHRLEVSFPEPLPPAPPFVIHFESFRRAESPQDAFLSLSFDGGRMVMGRIWESMVALMRSSRTAGETMMSMVHHIQVKNGGANPGKMRVEIKEARVRTDYEGEQHGRGHRSSVVALEKIEPYMKVGRLVHIFKVVGAFELGDEGCHTVNDYLHVLNQAYRPGRNGRPRARPARLDAQTSHGGRDVLHRDDIEEGGYDYNDIADTGPVSPRVASGHLRAPLGSSTPLPRGSKSSSAMPKSSSRRARRGASVVSFAGAEERSFHKGDPVLDVSRGHNDSGGEWGRDRLYNDDSEDGSESSEAIGSPGGGPRAVGLGARVRSYRQWARVKSAPRGSPSVHNGSFSREGSVSSDTGSGRYPRSRSGSPAVEKFLTPYEMTQGVSVGDGYARAREESMFDGGRSGSQRKLGPELDAGVVASAMENIIPPWERRLERMLGKRVPITVDYASFSYSRDPQRAFESFAEGEAESTIERAVAAIRRVITGRRDGESTDSDGSSDDEDSRHSRRSKHSRRSGGKVSHLYAQRLADGLSGIHIANAPTKSEQRSIVRSIPGSARKRRSKHAYPTEASTAGTELLIASHFDSGVAWADTTDDIEDALRTGLSLGTPSTTDHLADKIIPSWERRLNRDLRADHFVPFTVLWDTFHDDPNSKDALETLETRDGGLVLGRITEAVMHLAASDPEWRRTLARRLVEVRISNAVPGTRRPVSHDDVRDDEDEESSRGDRHRSGNSSRGRDSDRDSGRDSRTRDRSRDRQDKPSSRTSRRRGDRPDNAGQFGKLAMRCRAVEADRRSRSDDGDGVVLEVTGVYSFGEIGCHTERQYRVALQDAMDLVSKGPDLNYLRKEIERDVIPVHVETVRKATKRSKSGGSSSKDDFPIACDWDSFTKDPRVYRPAVVNVHDRLGAKSVAPIADTVASMCREKEEWREAIRSDLRGARLVQVPTEREAKAKVVNSSRHGGSVLELRAPFHLNPPPVPSSASIRQAILTGLNLEALNLDVIIRKVNNDVIPVWERKYAEELRRHSPSDVRAGKLGIEVDWESFRADERGEIAAQTLLSSNASNSKGNRKGGDATDDRSGSAGTSGRRSSGGGSRSRTADDGGGEALSVGSDGYGNFARDMSSYTDDWSDGYADDGGPREDMRETGEESMPGAVVFYPVLVALRKILRGGKSDTVRAATPPELTVALSSSLAQVLIVNNADSNRAKFPREGLVDLGIESGYASRKRQSERGRKGSERSSVNKPVYAHGPKHALMLAHTYSTGAAHGPDKVVDGLALAVMRYHRKRADKRLALSASRALSDAAGATVDITIDWPSLGFEAAAPDGRKSTSSSSSSSKARSMNGAASALAQWLRSVEALVGGSRGGAAGLVAERGAKASRRSSSSSSSSSSSHMTVRTVTLGHAKNLEESVRPLRTDGGSKSSQQRAGNNTKGDDDSKGNKRFYSLRVLANTDKGEAAFGNAVSVSHAVACGTMTEWGRVSEEDAKEMARMIEEGSQTSQSRSGDAGYVAWLTMHPCYGSTTPDEQAILDNISRSALPSDAKLLKAYIIPKVGRDDREKDRAVYVTDRAIYVEDPSRKGKKKVVPLSSILFVQAGQFKAEGALSSGKRRPHVDVESGVRLHLATSGERVNPQLVQSLSRDPRDCLTLCGKILPASSKSGASTKRELMRASALEVASLISIAAGLGSIGSKDPIPRKPKFGSGLRSAGYNSSNKGLFSSLRR